METPTSPAEPATPPTPFLDKPPYLTGATFQFSQDGNTLGTTGEVECLEITLEYQLPGSDDADGAPFVVVKSESGWSINDAKDLAELIEECIDVHGTMLGLRPCESGECKSKEGRFRRDGGDFICDKCWSES